MTTKTPRLRITEIFYSLQGETNTVGIPTVFIRLTGCPLRCNYCDTEYAFSGGEMMEVKAILKDVSRHNTKHVTVTGGEPLAQKECHYLLKELCDRDYIVSLETSGAISVKDVDQRVIKVVDIKTPASGESSKNKIENISFLNKNDQLKFVICDEADYQWAKQFCVTHGLSAICEVLFSPAYEELKAQILADWILKDNLNVRLQIQLHKYLWGNVAGK